MFIENLNEMDRVEQKEELSQCQQKLSAAEEQSIEKSGRRLKRIKMKVETSNTQEMPGASIPTRMPDKWGSCTQNASLEKTNVRYLTRSRSKDKIIAHNEGSSNQKLSPTKLRSCPYQCNRSPASEANPVVNDLNKCTFQTQSYRSSLKKNATTSQPYTNQGGYTRMSTSEHNSCISKKTPNQIGNESVFEASIMSFDDDQAAEFKQMLAHNYDDKASVTSNNVVDDGVMHSNDANVINTTQDLHTHFNGIEAETQIQDTVEQRDAMDSIIIYKTMPHTWNNFDVTSDNVRVENRVGNIDLRHTIPSRQKPSTCHYTRTGMRHEKTVSAPSLNDNDLDIDTIIITCPNTSYPGTTPTGVPADFPDAAFGHTRRRPFAFPFLGIRKDDKESAVYIPHQYATDDPKLGDRFGVNIWTDTSSKKDGYYRHFFQKVEEGTPANKMQIRNKDEIVLIDGHFVPDLNHEQIMELFRHIAVDGVSRLEMILRRKDTPRMGTEMRSKWEWFQTSAILVPELNEEPKTTATHYTPLKDNFFDMKTWQRYKLSGTQLFLTIDSSGMGADIIRGKPHDKSKLIQKHSRVCEDQRNPDKIVYMASLRCADETYYAMIDMHRSVVTTTEEKFFQWQKAGTEIFFKQHDLYLNCDDKRVSASKKMQMFEEFPMPGHKDMVDGQDDGYDSGSPPGTLSKRVTRSMSRQPSVTTHCLMTFECFSPFRNATCSS